jgi:Fe-S cluster assembly protein SufD
MAVTVRSSKGRNSLADLTGDRLSSWLSTSLANDPITIWRQESFRRARLLPSPSNKEEDFKYLNLRRFDFGDLTPIEVINTRNRNGDRTTEITSGLGSIQDIPGRLRISEHDPDTVDGYFFGSLADAAAQMPEKISRYLALIDSQFPARKLALLSHAYLSNGTFFYLPAKGVLRAPRQLYSKLSGDHALTSYAKLVVLEPQAQADLAWDIGADPGASGFFNGTLDIIAHAGSKLTLMFSQQLIDNLDSNVLIRAYLEDDAEVEIATINAGGGVVQVEVDLRLAGRGSRAVVNGIYLAGARESFNFLTHQDHQVGDTNTNVYYAGTLAGRSTASYLGKITIAEGAQQSDAYQTNRNLVLNRGVRVNSSPKLEISANDVRCSHGATTARVSDSEMFYLRSRGLGREEARNILAEGFLEQVKGRVRGETLRQGFADRLGWLLANWSGNGSTGR